MQRSYDRHGMNIDAATFQYSVAPDNAESLSDVFLIESSEVKLHVGAKGTSKCQRNLTDDELARLAGESGVQARYQNAALFVRIGSGERYPQEFRRILWSVSR